MIYLIVGLLMINVLYAYLLACGESKAVKSLQSEARYNYQRIQEYVWRVGELESAMKRLDGITTSCSLDLAELMEFTIHYRKRADKALKILSKKKKR